MCIYIHKYIYFSYVCCVDWPFVIIWFKIQCVCDIIMVSIIITERNYKKIKENIFFFVMIFFFCQQSTFKNSKKNIHCVIFTLDCQISSVIITTCQCIYPSVGIRKPLTGADTELGRESIKWRCCWTPAYKEKINPYWTKSAISSYCSQFLDLCLLRLLWDQVLTWKEMTTDNSNYLIMKYISGFVY